MTPPLWRKWFGRIVLSLFLAGLSAAGTRFFDFAIWPALREWYLQALTRWEHGPAETTNDERSAEPSAPAAPVRQTPLEGSLRLRVDRADRAYLAGEDIQLIVVSIQPGRLYLLTRTSDGRLRCAAPRNVRPGEAMTWTLQPRGPSGRLEVIAVAAIRPIAAFERAGLEGVELDAGSAALVESLRDRSKANVISPANDWSVATLNLHLLADDEARD